MNRPFLFATLIASQILPLAADSGGPYLAVPDATEVEKGPVFQIPHDEKPLRHFLTHIPEFQIDQKLQEPDNYTWKPLVGYHASLSSLDHAGGHALLCIRYISDKRIDQGRSNAEAILVLARNHDSGPDSTLCVPVFYATGQSHYFDWNATSLDTETYGGFKVTGSISGTGGFVKETFIRSQNWKFVRFQPKAPDSHVQKRSPTEPANTGDSKE